MQNNSEDIQKLKKDLYEVKKRLTISENAQQILIKESEQYKSALYDSKYHACMDSPSIKTKDKNRRCNEIFNAYKIQCNRNKN